jgi:hypothetical protein
VSKVALYPMRVVGGIYKLVSKKFGFGVVALSLVRVVRGRYKLVS